MGRTTDRPRRNDISAAGRPHGYRSALPPTLTISPNVGALHRHLTNVRTHPFYNRVREEVKRLIHAAPRIGSVGELLEHFAVRVDDAGAITGTWTATDGLPGPRIDAIGELDGAVASRAVAMLAFGVNVFDGCMTGVRAG